ncbi:uncharacterized protein [Amphiura filiformis]|uniref:uncharacterized protein n=1 Tax=Amphiura filiformis TaxID=82378 RepID=UPI003B216DBD
MSKHPDYMGTGFAMHHNRRLKWDQKLNLIGEKVFDPMIHCCGKCRLPILSYGRMIPCKHVFCFDCAKSTDKVCLRCGDAVQLIEQSPLGKIFICTFGSAKHSTSGCRRTYLSGRDLQAHINHRHNRLQPQQQQQQPQQQQQQQQREQPQQQQQQQSTPMTTASAQDQSLRSQNRMPDTPVSDHRPPGYETFSQPPPPPNQGVMHNPYEEEPDAMPDSPTTQEEYGMGRIQVRKSNLITVPLQDNRAPQHPPPPQHAPQHPPPSHHAPPPQQHPPQHPPSVSVYQSNMPGQLPQQHPAVPPPPPQHGYPQHGPVSYAPPMVTHSVPQSVPRQQPQPQNPHYSMAPPPPVPPVSHMGQPPPRYDSGPPHPSFSGQVGPMANQSPPFQSAVLPTSTQWNPGLGPPPPRIIMTQAPSMPAPVPAPGMPHPQSGPPPPRPDMGPPPPRTDGRYRTPYFS